jgi:hypothetical protein
MMDVALREGKLEKNSHLWPPCAGVNGATTGNITENGEGGISTGASICTLPIGVLILHSAVSDFLLI